MPRPRTRATYGRPALYPFTCPLCDRPGKEGDPIVHVGGHYVHADCHLREHS